VTVYRVTWRVVGMEDDYWVNEVIVTEGYTTVLDIPKILATRYLGGPEDADLAQVVSLVVVEDGD
jgi:hypothetical protein